MSTYEKAVQEELARQRAAYEAALAAGDEMAPMPASEESIRAMLAHLMEPEPSPEMIPAMPPDLSQAIYKVGERYYSVPDEAWVDGAAVDAAKVIELGGPDTDENLRETLEFYHLPVGACLLSTEDLFAMLRAERDRRIAATDYIMCPDYPATEEARSSCAAYRQALRDMPQSEGAPWDGGGPMTPWPSMIEN